MPQHVCNRCGWIFKRKSNLTQHLTSRAKPCRPTNVVTSADNVGDQSKICEKKSVPQPCDEIIHFDSEEFADGGEPKSLETLKKLHKLINKEVPEKKIGMGTAIPSPAIGYVASSAPGVPGKQQQQKC